MLWKASSLARLRATPKQISHSDRAAGSSTSSASGPESARRWQGKRKKRGSRSRAPAAAVATELSRSTARSSFGLRELFSRVSRLRPPSPRYRGPGRHHHPRHPLRGRPERHPVELEPEVRLHEVGRLAIAVVNPQCLPSSIWYFQLSGTKATASLN